MSRRIVEVQQDGMGGLGLPGNRSAQYLGWPGVGLPYHNQARSIGCGEEGPALQGLIGGGGVKGGQPRVSARSVAAVRRRRPPRNRPQPECSGRGKISVARAVNAGNRVRLNRTARIEAQKRVTRERFDQFTAVRNGNL